MACTVNNNNLPLIKGKIQDAITDALIEIGVTVEGEAAKRAPVGTPESTHKKGYRGGSLRQSITSQLVDDNKVAIGTNIEYATYVELGTSKMKAKPYLRPALDDKRDEIPKILEKHLQRKLNS